MNKVGGGGGGVAAAAAGASSTPRRSADGLPSTTTSRQSGGVPGQQHSLVPPPMASSTSSSSAVDTPNDVDGVSVSSVFAAVDDTPRKIARRLCIPVSELLEANPDLMAREEKIEANAKAKAKGGGEGEDEDGTEDDGQDTTTTTGGADGVLDEFHHVVAPVVKPSAVLLDPAAALVPIPDDLFAVSYAGAIPVSDMLLPSPAAGDATTNVASSISESRRWRLTPAEEDMKRRLVDYAAAQLNAHKVRCCLVGGHAHSPMSLLCLFGCVVGWLRCC